MDSPRPRSLTDYVRIARRRKLLVIIPAIVLAAASSIAATKLPDVYESSTVVAFESPQQVTGLERQVTDRARLEAVIKNCGLYDELLRQGTRMEDCTARMSAQIRVAPDLGRDPQSQAFSISYRAQDPELARKVLAELLSELASAASSETGPARAEDIDSLRHRAAQLAAQVRELEERQPWTVAPEAEAQHAPAPPARAGGYTVQAEALRAQQMTIEDLKDQQYKLQQQLADYDQRITAQRQLVEHQKKNAPLRDNPTIAALIAKRAELQGLRDNLINRQELTDKHPRVTTLSDQITAVDRQIAELRQQDSGAVGQTPEARELVALESERNRLRLELEVTNRALDRHSASLPAQPKVAAPPARVSSPARRGEGSTRLAEYYQGLKNAHQEAVERIQAAEQGEATNSVKAERLSVLREASLAQSPAWPNRPLIGLAAFALGLLLGVVLALSADSRRFATVQDERDVEYYARLPLLATVPLTLTREQRRQGVRRAMARVSLGSALAAAATFVLTNLLIVTELFAFIGNW